MTSLTPFSILNRDKGNIIIRRTVTYHLELAPGATVSLAVTLGTGKRPKDHCQADGSVGLLTSCCSKPIENLTWAKRVGVCSECKIPLDFMAPAPWPSPDAVYARISDRNPEPFFWPMRDKGADLARWACGAADPLALVLSEVEIDLALAEAFHAGLEVLEWKTFLQRFVA